MDSSIGHHSKTITEEVKQLKEINSKLTALHWITAQIVAEQDMNTLYNLIINGFSEITSVPKCGFYLVDDNYNFIEAANRNKEGFEAFWLCPGVVSAIHQVIKERIAIITLNEGHCDNCVNQCSSDIEDKCQEMRLQICALYDRLGKPTGLLVAYDFNNHQFNEEWVKVLEIYTLQVSLALENAILNNRLRDLAVKDGLTGLYNHRCFMGDLDKTINRYRKNNLPCCLMLLDVDDFKKYNDTYGHPAGDKILQAMAKIMINTVKELGTVYRYGGEEFAIILPGNELNRGNEIAENIRTNIAAHKFEHRQITVSIGIAEYPFNAVQVNDLIECADQSLYVAKKQGKNRVCLLENSSESCKAKAP
ncbi:MAG: sensor domain-containing diguanylate cyclase [Firmicutes bacterium]|nr:sensor domain-containing diguanylate cyclase [Bacillota bacterium]